MSTRAEEPIRTLALPGSEPVVVLGQGTWGLGEDARHRTAEIAALRLGLDVRLTAEDLMELDREFPPPTRKLPLEMI